MNRIFQMFLWMLVVPVGAQTTIDRSLSHAYGANCGWVNLVGDTAHGVVVTEWFLAGKAWSANCGWIDLGDGTPTDGTRYSNASAADCGVNLDPSGNLTGFAYAANVGWIQLGWAGSGDPNRPWIDLASGMFHGFAYGANVGWIKLGPSTLATGPLALPDSDGDHIGDPWEWEHFGALEIAGIGTDWDHDGSSDAAEAIALTDPKDATDFLKIVSHVFGSGHATLTLVFTTQGSRRYRIEIDDDLAGTWSDSGLGVFEPDSGSTTTKQIVVPAGSRRFFRVAVLAPLFP